MPRQEYSVLVVGAGIGGIRSALDLAKTGHKVLLIDKQPHHGGLLSQLDSQFPSNHCGMCQMLPVTERDESSQFCLRKGLFHRNIDILFSSTLISLEGEPGKFQVTVRTQSSLVDPNKCVNCGQCSTVCPVRVPDEFNAGLGKRAAIYLPLPYTIPNQYVIDLNNCLRCWQCAHICPTGAVDLKLNERQNFHILIAHHDSDVRADMATRLQDGSFPLHWAATGEDALQMVEQETRLGLVLLDIDFSDVEAKRILQRGLECQGELQVVVLCDSETEDQARELISQGARELLNMQWIGDFQAWLDKLFMRITSETIYHLEVGAVILATGFECYDPSPVHDLLGYKDLPQVVTSLEFERLLSSTGPTEGTLQRPDGFPVRSVAWLQCIGSRDLQKNADFCSSICCMASIKEALLVKERIDKTVDTTIFAMDVRTYGKGYQRYRDRAEQEYGVRFVRARPHSVTVNGQAGLELQYLGDNGQMESRSFDLVVLATGVRPPKDMDHLIQATGMESNPFGFCLTDSLAPTRTSQFGIFAAGAFGEPKDIADTVILASAAALEASRLICLYAAPKAENHEPEPVYRRVDQEAPKTLIVLCDACPTLEENVNMEALTVQLQEMPTVHNVVRIPRICTEAGWQDIERQVRQDKPNRIILGACLPYAHIPRLRQLSRNIALDPAFMEVVDIYTSTFPDVSLTSQQRLREIAGILGMAVVKVRRASPSPRLKPVSVTPKALVVGAGLAGMTAAIAIADHGIMVCLVEKKRDLGGTAKGLRFTLDGRDPAKYLNELIEQVYKHPKIEVHTQRMITHSTGRAGQFVSTLQSENGQSSIVAHGITILATGGYEAKVSAYGYGTDSNIFTQLEFEDSLSSGVLDAGGLSAVVMIQCVECREEPRNYCSRVCCSTTIKHALILKQRNPELSVYILYRDMMTYGFNEQYFTQARRLGVVFIRYTTKTKPEVQRTKTGVEVNVYEQTMRRFLKIQADVLVLATGIMPNKTEELSRIFQVPIDQDGFFQEAELKWRPVEFLRQGIFLCGLARAPGNMPETVASAKAAAQRALRLLSHERISGGSVTAEVRHSLCSLCQICVKVCPYGARVLDWDKEQIVVDEILCQGCGCCAAVCPNSAAVLRGFQDDQVMAEIEASLNIIP
jgi:heterodisulfide reductase subunit A